MASYKDSAKRRYTTPGAVDGNLARKLDDLDRSGRMDFDELYERRPETALERNARRRAQARAAARPAQKVSPLALLGFVCTAFLMVVLLLCYVRLNTISRSIVSMKEEIKVLEVEQVALLTQYEQTFDLSAVKEAAMAAGMRQPSESQIFYISLPGEDQVRSSHSGGGLLERLSDSLNRGILAAAEYFR